ncbi:septum formation inhibitor Maf [Olleya sp. YS]|uniref:septum formation inhibitor Maf n=1 Tax=Olleya sp. YS TaxID=3028318 RepID=UPI0024341357|nr:septum formation inhibitor Maf [Olleya sp. YS]WGD34923.1 septum formation inhibitor Maf [Olleya sp. YS]
MKTLKTLLFVTTILLFSCNKNNRVNIKDVAKTTVIDLDITEESTYKPNKQFNDYWYAGEAEITSYKLEQARYGEIREGHAVLVYVTESFLAEAQVKADQSNTSNINVLKLNSTKNFNTGIYPYSIMQSTFYPVANNQHAIKVSASIQEWCGQVYTQLNNREQFQVTSHSYFQWEADQQFTLEKTVLENEIWTQLRINPNSLPTGYFSIIPNLEFIRLNHKPLKGYNAFAENAPGKFKLTIKDLDKILEIYYNPEFPYDIKSWSETTNGLTTKATKLKSIKSAYWNKNSNTDLDLRKTLDLE